jgi:multiple sugar transport system ATP-binding protein
MTTLSLVGISKHFAKTQALNDVELAVSKGEFLCLVGPTNAGKSTLLKTIAGLHRPDKGSIFIKGRDVTELDPSLRHVSLLFQTVALFPNRSGFDNLAFPLRQAGIGEEKVKQRVREVADLLRIGQVLDRFPRTFSGGERQRVAIGRAIAHPADLLLLDEPLSNLDARMRLELRIEFRRLHRTLGQTVIYVTHDQVEALSLADRVAVLHAGCLQQVDTPERVHDRPVNRFVAEFIGSPPMNLIPARVHVQEEGIKLAGVGFQVEAPPGLRPSTDQSAVWIGVRPEAVRLSVQATDETPFAVQIRWVEHHGSRSIVHADLGGTIIKAAIPPDRVISVDSAAWLGFTPKLETLLDGATDSFDRNEPLPTSPANRVS